MTVHFYVANMNGYSYNTIEVKKYEERQTRNN